MDLFELVFFVSLGYMQELELLGHVADLIFWEVSILFSTMAAQFTFSPPVHEGQVSHILTNI